MKSTLWFALVGLTLLMMVTGSGAVQGAAPTPTLATTPNAGMNIRNTRYCEILPIVLKQGKLVAAVYNTLGLNDCPTDAWSKMDVAAIKQQFGALEVELNGPRYWMMDQIIGKGATQSGETVIIGGLGFTKRAEVVLTPRDLRKITVYQERDIERETQYIFKAGQPTFQLVAPDGKTYVMQTYAQIVDTKLTYQDLPKLGERLKLPKGWKFQMVTPDKDLVLTATGIAHLVQDDLDNSYQRLEAADLVATPSK